MAYRLEGFRSTLQPQPFLCTTVSERESCNPGEVPESLYTALCVDHACNEGEKASQQSAVRCDCRCVRRMRLGGAIYTSIGRADGLKRSKPWPNFESNPKAIRMDRRSSRKTALSRSKLFISFLLLACSEDSILFSFVRDVTCRLS